MLVKTGSVKDIYLKNSNYMFRFSDRYSIFDWGEMPDRLNNKGEVLSFMAWFFFDYFSKSSSWEHVEIPKPFKNEEIINVLEGLRSDGLSHHCLGMCDDNGELVNPLDKKTSRNILAKSFNVINPSFERGSWDYTEYQKRPTNTIIPLEVIFRFGAPEGSSLFKRLNDKKYKKEIGIEGEVIAGEWFDFPVIEFSSKLESHDRYLTYEEAKYISGMSDKEFNRLKSLTQVLAIGLAKLFKEIDVELWDGKFEYAFSESLSEEMRKITLIDSIGPDELRLSYKSTPLSKENLRKFYSNSNWHKAIIKSKNLASQRKVKDWKSICTNELKESPGVLNSEFKNYSESIYTALANNISKHYLNKNQLFKNTKSLEEVSSFFKKV